MSVLLTMSLDSWFCEMRGEKGVENTFVWKYYEVVTPGLLDKRTLYCRVGL